jgi:hypothetical protein
MKSKAMAWTLAGAIVLGPCMNLRAGEAAPAAPKDALMLASAQIQKIGAPDGTLLAMDVAPPDDSGSDSSTPANPRRKRIQQDDSGSDDSGDAPTPASRRRVHPRISREREHHVLVGLLVPSLIVAVVGVGLMVDGFWDNPQPNGSSTLDWYHGSGTYVYNSGVYSNTGNGGVFPTFTISQENGSGAFLDSFSFDFGDSVPTGGTYDWYYDLSTGYNATYESISTTQISDGTYAANSVTLGVVGVVCVALGLTGSIIALTHTQDVMADNDIKMDLKQADSNEVMLAASKGF